MHPETNRNRRWARGLAVIIAALFCLPLLNQPSEGGDSDFEFSGTIQALPGASGFIGDWTVSGRTVHVSASTMIERENNVQIIVGAGVKVEGFLQTDGSVNAKEITVKQGFGGGSNFSFTGNVEELPNTTGRIGDWKVTGTIVHVSATTFIEQDNAPVAVGVVVQVEGARRADGSVGADKIEVKSEPGGGNGSYEQRAGDLARRSSGFQRCAEPVHGGRFGNGRAGGARAAGQSQWTAGL